LRYNGTARGQQSPNAREADLALAELLAGMAEIATRDAGEPTDALEAEQWASMLIGTWHARPMPGQDVEAMFFPGFVDALEALGATPALATLRALAAVGGEAHGRRASAAADRLAARGLAESRWAATLGQAHPTAAALMSEEAFDDGLSVMVEYAGPGYEPHTLGIYIDHNMGGLVKDVFLAGPLTEVRGQFNRDAPNHVGLVIRDLDLDEARARVEAALYMLDHTYDPPVSEDVRPLRALVDARMRLLPDGFELPDDYSWPPPPAAALSSSSSPAFSPTSTSASCRHRSHSHRWPSHWFSCSGPRALLGRSPAGWPDAPAGARSRSSASGSAPSASH